ncbi:MAG: RagB/SusD family nutrient uptake outer membrane protein, partial [Bacteroidetes bacterium]|nr:RagB/SusD family nutrient uptake outer membrane protein [Bacteroidota bacterium]
VRLADSWKSLFKVNGWAASYKSALEFKKSTGGDASFLDPAIAECNFMIGTCYFYLGRAWGAVPIVTDPGKVALEGSASQIPRYLQTDVLRFASERLKEAESNLPETDVPGRLTKYVAKGMLAKLYLYRATALNETACYDSAKTKAAEVIASGKYALLPDYASLFNTSSTNNSIESLFAIQHSLNGSSPWGGPSLLQPDFGPSNLATKEANMWELYKPSLDIISAYEPGDHRRAGSVMEQGWSHPSWKPTVDGNTAYNAFMASGYVYDTLQPTGSGGQKNEVRSNIAKYVVGPGKSYGSETVLGMQTSINTMFLRYADVLLIYAEAVLGTNASTTDASALAAFNAVRNRAGLASKSSITKDDIFHERRVEFAFEGDYWFDVQRQGFTKAKAIIMAQNRGTVDNANYVTSFTQAMMYLPIPAGEIVTDPALAQDPVPYY